MKYSSGSTHILHEVTLNIVQFLSTDGVEIAEIVVVLKITSKTEYFRFYFVLYLTFEKRITSIAKI